MVDQCINHIPRTQWLGGKNPFGCIEQYTQMDDFQWINHIPRTEWRGGKKTDVRFFSAKFQSSSLCAPATFLEAMTTQRRFVGTAT